MSNFTTYERSPVIQARMCEWREELRHASKKLGDPFDVAHVACDPITRSLEVSPYAFLTAGWLERNARSFASNTKAGRAWAAATKKSKQPLAVAVNFRMLLPHRAERAPLSSYSVAISEALVPVDPSAIVAIVTLTFGVLPEALLARQLHSREFCIAGGALIGFEESRGFDRVHFELVQRTPLERAQIAALTRAFGADKAAALFDSLHRCHPNTLAHLVAQCLHTPLLPGAKSYRETRRANAKAKQARARSASRSDDEEEADYEDEESGETIGSEDTEEEQEDEDGDELESDSLIASSDGDSELSIARPPIPPARRLVPRAPRTPESSSSSSSSSDTEAPVALAFKDNPLAFMAESIDSDTESGDSGDASPLLASVQNNPLAFMAESIDSDSEESGVAENVEESAPAAPAPEPRPFREHRTNELAWMQLAVQTGAVELLFELTFLGEAGVVRARSDRFQVSSALVPFSIGNNADDDLPLLTTTAERLASTAPPCVFVFSEYEEKTQEVAVEEIDAAPAVEEIEVAAAPPENPSAAAQPRASTKTTLGRLAYIDIGEYTLIELELYGLRRLEALFALQMHGERPALYSRTSGLSRYQRETLGQAAKAREYWHQTAGLFVLCAATALDATLRRSLMTLERRWCAPEEAAAHCRDIAKFLSETPASLAAADDDENQDAGERSFVAMLETIVRRWREFISSQ